MNIIGHQKIINLLNKSIEKNAVSQAYLFSGPESVGKFTVAKMFAEKLIGKEGNINPDLKIIQPEIEFASTRKGRLSPRDGEKKGAIKKLDIKIEEMRDLLHWLSLSAQSGKYKVAIIDDADFMTGAAQNAILKNLEEPNPGVVLILVSQDENKIISTIRSRCRRVRFSIVADEELEKNLAAQKNKEEIIFWSFGRPGIALSLASSGVEIEFMRESKKELEALFSKNIAERFSLAEKLAKDETVLVKKMNLWLMILRRMMLESSGGGSSSRKKMLDLIEKIGEGLELVRETNSSSRLILENLFLIF